MKTVPVWQGLKRIKQEDGRMTDAFESLGRMPTKEEIQRLPFRAIVAFAARCVQLAYRVCLEPERLLDPQAFEAVDETLRVAWTLCRDTRREVTPDNVDRFRSGLDGLLRNRQTEDINRKMLHAARAVLSSAFELSLAGQHSAENWTEQDLERTRKLIGEAAAEAARSADLAASGAGSDISGDIRKDFRFLLYDYLVLGHPIQRWDFDERRLV
jgi:hypothetical protein